MRPVGIIKGEINPGGEEAILRGTWDDEADILRQILLVVLEGCSSLARMITPDCE